MKKFNRNPMLAAPFIASLLLVAGGCERGQNPQLNQGPAVPPGKQKPVLGKAPERDPEEEAKLAAQRQKKLAALEAEERKLIPASVPKTFRSFSLKPNENSLVGVFSNDGRYLAGLTLDKKIPVWDLKSGETFTLMFPGKYSVNDIALSPDGNLLVAASSDAVCIWELPSRKQVDLLTKQTLGYQFQVGQISFSPDGAVLAIGGDRVTLWDLKGKKKQADFKDDDTPGFLCRISPNGKILAYGSGGSQITLLNLATGQRFRVIDLGEDNQVFQLSFSPDGCSAAASTDKGIFFLDLVANQELKLPMLDFQRCSHAVGFSPDGKVLACSTFKEFLLWDVPRKEVLYRNTKLSGLTGAITFSPGGVFLVAMRPQPRWWLVDDLLNKSLQAEPYPDPYFDK